MNSKSLRQSRTNHRHREACRRICLSDVRGRFGLAAVVALLSILAGNVHANESAAAARRQLDNCMQRIVHGPAYDASLRHTVWSANREVIGVGNLIVAGGGSSRYRVAMTMHDGLSKHTMVQISDGRLAWTRNQIGETITLRRVDVSRLDAWVRDNELKLTDGAQDLSHDHSSATIRPGHKVGGLVEMLDTLSDGYDLRITSAELAGATVAVITATMNEDGRQQLMNKIGTTNFSSLQPTEIRLVIAGADDIKTGFGRGLPVRMEYWSDPVQLAGEPDEAKRQRRMISLVEFHSLRQIEPPDANEFRFENRDAEVEFTNETDRYLGQYGIRLTEAQRGQLRR